jgi:hypothetical protein
MPRPFRGTGLVANWMGRELPERANMLRNQVTKPQRLADHRHRNWRPGRSASSRLSMALLLHLGWRRWRAPPFFRLLRHCATTPAPPKKVGWRGSVVKVAPFWCTPKTRWRKRSHHLENCGGAPQVLRPPYRWRCGRRACREGLLESPGSLTVPASASGPLPPNASAPPPTATSDSCCDDLPGAREGRAGKVVSDDL